MGANASPRLTAAEASLVGALGLFAIGASLAVGGGGRGGVAGAAFAILALTIVVIDCRCFIIPDQLNLAALIVGLAATALAAPAEPHTAIVRALLRATVMFLAFFAFRAGYRRVRGVEGLGLGDVKLAGVAGVWLDWIDLPVAVDIAAVAALAAAVLSRLRGKNLDMKARLPFGAFLAPSIWLCWLITASRDNGAFSQGLALLIWR